MALTALLKAPFLLACLAHPTPPPTILFLLFPRNPFCSVISLKQGSDGALQNHSLLNQVQVLWPGTPAFPQRDPGLPFTCPRPSPQQQGHQQAEIHTLWGSVSRCCSFHWQYPSPSPLLLDPTYAPPCDKSLSPFGLSALGVRLRPSAHHPLGWITDTSSLSC